jgi:hypothetical protein
MAGGIWTKAKPHGRQCMAAAGGKRQNLAVAPLIASGMNVATF